MTEQESEAREIPLTPEADTEVASVQDERALTELTEEKTATDLTGKALVSEEEVADSRHPQWSQLVLYGVLVLLLGLFGVGSYRLYPFQEKIRGNWVSTENPNMRLTVDRQQTRLTVANVQGKEGFSLVFDTTLAPKGANKYKGKQTRLYLDVAKKGLSADEITEIKDKKGTYRVTKETKKSMQIEYDSDTLKSLYPEGLDRLFDLTLQDFQQGLTGAELVMRNPTFAENGLVFTRQP